MNLTNVARLIIYRKGSFKTGVATQILPISSIAWNHWLKAATSRNTMKTIPKKPTDFDKVVAHCQDIVADKTGVHFPKLQEDFRIEYIR